MKETFRAFRNRNYALFFGGQSTSQIGTWMQRTAVSWVVFSMTHSTFMLGLSIFAAQFPSFLFSLVGGIAADRYDRYRILLITQAASMIQAILMAALVLTGHTSVWTILALSVILGVINAFDVPARQPLVHQLIDDKEDLPNALALNSSMVNVARLIGPALSGLILQSFGAGICFLINAISFVAVICSLLLMQLPAYKPAQVRKKAAKELAEGFAYIMSTPAISMALLLLALLSLLVLPYDTLLPVFAKVVFNGDAATFGYICSFIGIGAVISSLFLASLPKGINLSYVLLGNIIVLGIGLMIFSQISYFPLAMVFAVLFGFGAMGISTICITIIQVNADVAMRGRAMSFVALGFFGMLPLGSLLVGVISQHIGAPYTLLAQGALALSIAAAFYGYLRRDRQNSATTLQIEQAEEIATENI